MKRIILLVYVMAIANVKPQAQTLEWAKQFGNNEILASGNSIALDDMGNSYFAGSFIGTVDFDPGPSVFSLSSVGIYANAFICKLDNAGNLVWAKQIVCTGWSEVHGLTVDSEGNVYSTGYFMNTADFDPGIGEFNLTAQGNRDVFVSKLDGGGNFIWARNFGGTSENTNSDMGKAIAADSSGDVYISGVFRLTADFDPSEEVYELTVDGYIDAFICKLDASGNFEWVKRIGGPQGTYDFDEANGLAVDNADYIYTVGTFNNTADFTPYTLTSNEDSNGFIAKLDTDGNYIWAKRTGAVVNDVAMDALNNVYLTGHFYGDADFDAINLTSEGVMSIMLAKMDTDGSFIWARQMENDGQYPNNTGYAIALDEVGNIFVTGTFTTTMDFDAGEEVFELSVELPEYYPDVFVVKYTNSGYFDWAVRMGAGYPDHGNDIAVDENSNIHTVGNFELNVDFDPGPGVFELSSPNGNIFVQKLNPETVSISEFNHTASLISIFPNPSSSHVVVRSEAKVHEVIIYNLKGELIQIENRNSFSVENLAAGLYVLHVRTELGIQTSLLTKK